MGSKPFTDPPADLVGQVYEGLFEPGCAPAVLAAIASYVGATCVQMHTRDIASGEVHGSEMGAPAGDFESLNRQYLARWGAADPLAAAVAKLPLGGLRVCHQEVDGHFVASSPFYQAFLLPQRLRWGACGIFDAAEGRARLITAWRALDRGPFPEPAVQRLQALLPHLRRSLAVHRRAEEHAQASRAAAQLLEDLPVAYVLTDVSGRCIESNEAFRLAAPQLALRPVQNRLRFDRPDQQDTWAAALKEVFVTGLAGRLDMTAASGARWCATLKPWTRPAETPGGAEAHLILGVFEEQLMTPAARVLSPQLYARLDPAERELLGSLASGMSVKHIADHRHAPVQSVRRQLMALLGKTGFETQQAIVTAFRNSGLMHDSGVESVPQSTRLSSPGAPHSEKA